jgi:hypothetical protein
MILKRSHVILKQNFWVLWGDISAMIWAMVHKEWFKMSRYLGAIFLLSCLTLGYLGFELRDLFANTEPESMVWYQFAQLEQKPYRFLALFFASLGLGIALVQYLPERMGKRVKLLMHLPIALETMLLVHLLIGGGIIGIISLWMALVGAGIMQFYYPPQIVMIFCKESAFYSLGALFAYLATSAVVLERHSFRALGKLCLGLATLFIFFQPRFDAFDRVWILLLPFWYCLCLDSLYGMKFQRLKTPLFASVLLLGLGWLGFEAYGTYERSYERVFNRYYLFYSPIKEAFVYQKNFGDHRFSYGVYGKESFGQKEYEALLPFVYWKDLEMQNKLPVRIHERIFSKDEIQNSRLSFSYTPKDRVKKEVELYPLLNPKTDEGIIAFPEEALVIGEDTVRVYRFDEKLDKRLTDEIEAQFNALHVSFPLKGFWGKATHLKPYDLGYLFLDAKERLFNLKRENSRIIVKEITYPEAMRIAYISLSENRQREVVGYAIDSASKLYMLDDAFGFHPLESEGFDADTMKFQFLSDPLHYLLRMDDGKCYRAVLFSKTLDKLREVTLDD